MAAYRQNSSGENVAERSLPMNIFGLALAAHPGAFIVFVGDRL
jgi:hypothetical protein